MSFKHPFTRQPFTTRTVSMLNDVSTPAFIRMASANGILTAEGASALYALLHSESGGNNLALEGYGNYSLALPLIRFERARYNKARSEQGRPHLRIQTISSSVAFDKGLIPSATTKGGVPVAMWYEHRIGMKFLTPGGTIKDVLAPCILVASDRKAAISSSEDVEQYYKWHELLAVIELVSSCTDERHMDFVDISNLIYRDCSFGCGQIMGSNHAMLGSPSPFDLVTDYIHSATCMKHVSWAMLYINKIKPLRTAIQEGDLLKAAAIYKTGSVDVTTQARNFEKFGLAEQFKRADSLSPFNVMKRIIPLFVQQGLASARSSQGVLWIDPNYTTMSNL